jgi:hypothetical protein
MWDLGFEIYDLREVDSGVGVRWWRQVVGEIGDLLFGI